MENTIRFNMDMIMDTIRELSKSQGFYGRLYNAICELDDEQYAELKQELESQNFKSKLDVILYFEQ